MFKPEDIGYLLLHNLFEYQVKKQPEKTALVFKENLLTYKDLNEKANILAHQIKAITTHKESVVALLCDRSFDTVISILAVLKAGGAYLPIDPNFPVERIEFMIEDSNAEIIVTNNRNFEELELKKLNIRSLIIDRPEDIVHENYKENPNLSQKNSDLAYIIYTSGTTGKPKGAMIEHRNVLSLLYSTQELFNFDENDIWSLFHTYCFDFSVWEIFGSLSFGGQLIIISKEETKDPKEFINTIVSKKITVLNQTPSSFYNLADEIIQNNIKDINLRFVIFGGEALKPTKLKNWKELFPQTKLINMYGITETTVHVTYKEITSREIEENICNIGKPIPSLQVYIMNNKLELLPNGQQGEICVAGEGVCRGYYNRDDLSNKKFVYSEQLNEKIYRSGDLAKTLESGELEYLGRIDSQVKIRGFRIELEEIEKHLLNFNPVKDAYLFTQNIEDDKAICSYVIPRIESAPTIHNFLKIIKNGANNKKAYELPNGWLLFYINEDETNFMFDEIIKNDVYFMKKIKLRKDACVLDVGANIGLFSIYTKILYPDSKIFAFEPIPQTFEILDSNATLYNFNNTVYNEGIYSYDGNVEFSFFPEISVLSSTCNNKDVTEEIKNYILNAKQNKNKKIIELTCELNEEQFKVERHKLKVKTISKIIEESAIDLIDLLKISVEKSEFEVLKGIKEKDWGKIKQIIIKVHDVNNTLSDIISLLKAKGFEVNIDKNEQTKYAYNLYAASSGYVRNCIPIEPSKNNKWHSPDKLIRDIKLYLSERVPDYMIPQTINIVDKIPLTSNGKIDTKTFLENNYTILKDLAKPKNEIENNLLVAWEEILGIDRSNISVSSNFFEIGGHSLLVIKLVNFIQKNYNVFIKVSDIYKYKTIQALADQIKNSHISVEIFRRKESEYFDLSVAQKQMYVWQKLNPGNTFKNVSVLYRLEGKCDNIKIEKTIEEIIRYHEVFRLSFSITKGKAVQKVIDKVCFKLDFYTINKNELDAKVNELIKQFDLASPPLVRGAIIDVSEPYKYLFIDMPHIITDGYSVEIFIDDFVKFYNHEPISNSKQIQLLDYLEWYKIHQINQKKEDLKEFWLSRFNIKPELLNLPTDFAFPEKLDYNGDSIVYELPDVFAKKYRQILKNNNLELFVYFFTAYQLLIEKLTNQKDIIISIPSANRNYPGMDNMIGLFVNTLAIRCYSAPNGSIAEYIEGNRKIILDCFENQEYPFEMLLEEFSKLYNYTTKNNNPLFSNYFNFQKISDFYETEDFKLFPHILKVTKEILPLSFDVYNFSEKILINLKYRVSLYKRQTVEQYLDNYIQILNRLLEDNNQSINSIL